MELKIAIPYERLEAFCRHNYIKRLAFFGSVLRDDFTSDSDIDVLVEFEQGKTPGFGFFAMQEKLSELLGRKVDLNTPGDLSPYYRDKVLKEAVTLYE
jgi:predicted nucleotidyltransferase